MVLGPLKGQPLDFNQSKIIFLAVDTLGAGHFSIWK